MPESPTFRSRQAAMVAEPTGGVEFHPLFTRSLSGQRLKVLSFFPLWNLRDGEALKTKSDVASCQHQGEPEAAGRVIPGRWRLGREGWLRRGWVVQPGLVHRGKRRGEPLGRGEAGRPSFRPCPVLADSGGTFRPSECLCARLVMSDFATPWAVSHQAPLPTGFSRQEYWSGLPFPPPVDLPYLGI